MKNIYFPEEDIVYNDLHFVCYMIERVARKLRQRNLYVAKGIGKEGLDHLLSSANVLHAENPLKIEQEIIDEQHLEEGDFDIAEVDSSLCDNIPSALDMGEVYARLVRDTLKEGESYSDAILRVYANPISKVIDNYSCSAYYEPSYVIAKAYADGGF